MTWLIKITYNWAELSGFAETVVVKTDDRKKVQKRAKELKEKFSNKLFVHDVEATYMQITISDKTYTV